MVENNHQPQVKVIRKGSEILVDGELFISRNRVEENDFYVVTRLDDFVASGKVRAFQAHDKLYYSKSDLDRAFPTGFFTPKS